MGVRGEGFFAEGQKLKKGKLAGKGVKLGSEGLSGLRSVGRGK